jgi:hypothetical protein
MNNNKLKVNILTMTASVKEHQNQLQYHLVKPIDSFFKKLFIESSFKAKAIDNSNPNDDLLLFQKQLKLVPNWNQHTLKTIIDLILTWLRNKHFKVTQSIKAVVVGRTMLMVAMGNSSSEIDERVTVDIPDKYQFIHKVLSQTAFELYSYPSLYRINKRDTELDVRDKLAEVNIIIKSAIEDTILDQLSSPAVFAYLDESLNMDEIENEDEPSDPEEEHDIIDVDIDEVQHKIENTTFNDTDNTIPPNDEDEVQSTFGDKLDEPPEIRSIDDILEDNKQNNVENTFN